LRPKEIPVDLAGAVAVDRHRNMFDETLANLSVLPPSVLPPEEIAAIRAVLAGKTLADPASVYTVTRSLPHGHLAGQPVVRS